MIQNNDTISRQAAIDVVWSVVWSLGLQPSAIDALLNGLKGLPSAQPEPQWIPCDERLPEKAYGQYWVCTDTGYQCQCRWTDDVYGLGSSGEWAWKIFDIPQYSHVIAWIPLPESYEERR